VNFPVDTLWLTPPFAQHPGHPQRCAQPCPQRGVDLLWTTASITTVRRLYPTAGEDVRVHEVFDAIVRPRPADRPWVEVCMVASLDGATALEGRSGGLSHPTDIEVLAALRASADVVMVGSTTAHAERYGAPRRPGLRIGVVTNTGVVDRSLALFESGAGFLITTQRAPDLGIPAIRCGEERVDLRAALDALDAQVVHVEGGPTLNAALAADDLIDEVNLTISPAMVGGTTPRIAAGTMERVQQMQLAHVLEHEHFLYVRYERAVQDGSSTR